MQWLCCLWLTGSLIFFTLASLDFKKATSNKCDQISCYQGSCLNGTCACKPGWTGVLCESCNGRIKLNGSSGFIIDSPFNYSKELRCTWLLDGWEASAGSMQPGVLTLTVDAFATECGWDHLYIYDGDGVYSKQLAALSGDLTQVANPSIKHYVAESGRAYVFFYSDLAYNMSGFNVSFRWEQCGRNCSGHGECLSNGTCSCHGNWTGDYCEVPSCSLTCLNGKCGPESGECECNFGYRGPYCNLSADSDAWYARNSVGPGERASHAVAVVNNELYAVGGYHFVGANHFSTIAKYNFAQNSWLPVHVAGNASSGPAPRYDHSLVYYEELGALYMFGGITEQHGITDELWKFDIAKSSWSMVTPSTPVQKAQYNVTPDSVRQAQLQQQVLAKMAASAGFTASVSLTPPLAVAGHTAHVIRCNRIQHSCCDKMVVIQGYNPFFGYLSYVQEYFFSNNSWLIATTTGASVTGSYGHSSAYDDAQTNLIFVYGGFYATTPTNGQLSDRLYSYEPCKRSWKVYQSSGYEIFLHSAVILSKTMIVVGGNAHNESTPTKPTDCYSDVILAFDIECAQWRVFETPDYLHGRLARYGHRAVAYKEEMYIYGGFNGRLLDDIVKFSPAECSAYRDHDSCVGSRKGGKCYWVKGKCGSYLEAMSKLDDEKLDSSKMEKMCQFTGIGVPFDCSKLKDCATCVTNGVRACQWCNGGCRGECTSALAAPTGETPISNEDGCARTPAPCASYYTCTSCKLNEDRCIWARSKNQFNMCTERTERNTAGDVLIADRLTFDSTALAPSSQFIRDNSYSCPLPCAQLNDCDACVNSGCMWCSPLDRCVDMNAYLPSFPYGQCLQWSTSETQCQEAVPCSKHLTCAKCQAAGPRCGWCDDGSNTGLGKCLEGGNDGPVELVDPERGLYNTSTSKCPRKQWYFFDCPACQCNGHAPCLNASDAPSDQPRSLQCLPCQHETTGEHCEKCRDGYFGNALNGGNCTACECNSQATSCNSLTGKCYCTTKGVSGHNCDKCDQKYIGDPRNQTCFYELTVDFVFTFNLNSEDDVYITKINFVTRPPKENTDVTFKLTCAQSAAFVGKVNLSVGQVEAEGGGGWKYRKFLAGAACHEIERRFSAEEFQFGTSANTTFLVMLYDFRTPISITVSFAQTPTIDWMKFFVTFALCFFILLVIAFALWKIKQRVDVYRRRQRMFVEMEQMASRPFSSSQLEMSSAANARRQFATPIAVEPCQNYRAAVLSIALRMPTGGRKYAASGQSGLALASALCQITSGQLAQLQTPPSPVPEQKSKRRRPACMS